MNLNKWGPMIAAAAIGLAAVAPASALNLSPTPAAAFHVVPPSAAQEKSYIETFFGTSGLSRYYKAEYDDGDTVEENDPFKLSYETLFTHVQGEASGAVISYATGPSIACPECYLAVKDGNHEPSYYFFNLASWNGTETINLSGFWPQQGAISHISIWGKPGNTTNVPEPGSIALLGLGLAGLAAMRRRRAA